MQLTNEEKAKVMALYLGCKVNLMGEHTDDFEEPKTPKIFTLHGVVDDKQNNSSYCHCSDDEYSHEVEPSDCFLLLTSLKDISDEHAIEVAKMAKLLPFGWDNPYQNSKEAAYKIEKLEYPNKGVQVRCLDFSIRILESGSIYFFDYSRPNLAMHLTNSIEMFQYLISKGYDIPLYFSPGHWANSKTAIELGIAIEKKD